MTENPELIEDVIKSSNENSQKLQPAATCSCPPRVYWVSRAPKPDCS